MLFKLLYIEIKSLRCICIFTLHLYFLLVVGSSLISFYEKKSER